MHHEHHPGCGHEVEHLEHVHVAGSLGHLCCTGQCLHAEHQGLGMGQAMEANLFANEENYDFAEPEPKKRKKKKSLKTFGKLMADNA